MDMSGEAYNQEVIPLSLVSTTPFLRVVNEIVNARPRVAYLCRLHAYEKAHSLDPNSNNCGVVQFNANLLQVLEQEEASTINSRIEETDSEEISSYFLQYTRGLNNGDTCHYQTARVLYQVLCAVYNSQQVPSQVIDAFRDVEEKEKICKVYNIIPLDYDGVSHEILHLQEIKAAVSAIRNIDGLIWPHEFEKKTNDLDIFDWLGAVFGFQSDNVRNQREHLVMLLANVHTRLNPAPKPIDNLDDRAVETVMNKLFENYNTWCKFLGRCSRLPHSQQAVQHRKILFISLYLLIWGEAANVRFMPECLCYIFHNMAHELCGFLARKDTRPAHGRDDQSFLHRVITPLYRVIQKEAQKSEDGKAPHSAWCNYDDLNEYFWSSDCFSLGWPMHNDGMFFESMREMKKGRKMSEETTTNERKSNFVEHRTFWHIFHSFYRLWSFYILALQAMVIVAWTASPTISIFRRDVLHSVLSIFITASFLRLLQSILDAVINFPLQRRWIFTDVLRSFLKIIISLAWAVVLPVFYIRSFNISSQQDQDVQYFMTVALNIFPGILAAGLSLFPVLCQYFEDCDLLIVRFLNWWSQPMSYVGRGMHESVNSVIKYISFWVLVLASKFAFSYFVMIRPLVMSTKYIMTFNKVDFSWHEFSPQAQHNYFVLASLWVPVILVFFLDTQFWFSTYTSVCSEFIGARDRIGKIGNLKSLTPIFQTLPGAFARCLMAKSPSPKRDFTKPSESKRIEAAAFSQLWDEIVCCFREEDIVNDTELDLLLVPYPTESCFDTIKWPIFFLAGKIPIALDMAVQCRPRDSDLWKHISSDELMKCAVIECYESFKRILKTLVATKPEERIISNIFEEVESNIAKNTFLTNFKTSALPTLYEKVVKLVEYLRSGNPCERLTIVLLLQDMLEVVTRNMTINEMRGLVELGCCGEVRNQLFASIVLPEVTPKWKRQIQRLYLLLTVKNPTLTNLDAQRRIAFFANSLFMNMPCAPEVCKMLSFSVLTPYYSEETICSRKEIVMENEDGISLIHYLQKIFPDEWYNFMERITCKKEADIWESEENVLQLRHWVSLRGQTLFRTVRGMMYYGRALRLQAYIEMTSEVLEDCKAVRVPIKEDKKSPRPSYRQLAAQADLKFTYVITCQNYGHLKRNGDRRAADILQLMVNNPSLRVAYVDEVEDKEGTGKEKSFYSVLVKASYNREQEIYRIKLPGPPKVGEGKPENQNHAIIFTRGEALQAIDMNQDNYLEEALKMRNLLEEFNEDHGGRPPTVLGVYESCFTGSFSSLSWFMSNQETGFFSSYQRILARPLKVRFHYGHPDVFDRLFHITRGGISKASRGINLSEDIFAGFNSTLRCGNVTHHEYIQVGKGRDVGLNQISMFQAKVACGNGEQTLSRDVYRLSNHFDFFRMLSFYFTTIGCRISAMLTVLASYAFLYGRLYLSSRGLDQSLITPAKVKGETALNTTMIIVSLFQTGLLMMLPMLLKIKLAKGFMTTVMQLPLMAVFSTFSLGTGVHYYGRTILHGGAKYRGTGRGFVVNHEKFAENYRLYSRSHFTKGLELMMLLITYHLYVSPLSSSVPYVTAPLWFLVLSWLFAPFIFNPSGLEWQKIVDDLYDWMKWINSPGGYSVPTTKSWESWWDGEQEHLRYTCVLGRFWEIMLSLRFFLIQYCLVYHLHVADGDTRSMVYGLSWLMIIVVVIILKIESLGRNKLMEYRLFILFLSIGIVLSASLVFFGLNLTIGDALICLLASMPTGWALLLIAIACKPLLKDSYIWSSVKDLARGYDYMMGIIIFTPVAVISWFPFISRLQFKLIFNQAFKGFKT